MKRERRRPHGGKTRCISYIFYGKSTSVTISAPRAGITLQDAKTAANALVANKVILGSGDAELAAFTTAREVTTQTTELQ
jgi:hypothetical protein